MKTRKSHRFPALAAICMAMSGTASAVTQYWDGNASTANSTSDNSSSLPTNWLSGGNWDNGSTSAPLASWTSGDTAIFGGTFSGTQTVTLGSGINLGNGTTIGGAGSSYQISITGTGYNQLGFPPNTGTITIQAGSTLSADAAFNNAHNLDPLTLNGGTLTSINGPAGPANDGGYGNWLVRGVTTGGSSLSTISSTTLSIVSGSFTVADAVAGSGTDLLVSSNISAYGLGPLIKNGAGTMELTGANNYSGATSVNQGKLVVNGNISTSILTTVAAGAALGGTGTVGTLTVDGILAPGNSIGTITTTGDVTWNDNDSWVFELGTAATTLALAGSGSSTQDLLNITGGSSDFLKGSGSSFTFDFANGGAVGYYKLVDWAGTTSFADGDFVATNLLSGLTGSFTVDSGTSALYLHVVPEPNVAALIGSFGILGLLRRRR